MNTNLDPGKPNTFTVRWEPFRSELIERMYHTDQDFANVLHDTILLIEEMLLTADDPHNPNVTNASAIFDASTEGNTPPNVLPDNPSGSSDGNNNPLPPPSKQSQQPNQLPDAPQQVEDASSTDNQNGVPGSNQQPAQA